MKFSIITINYNTGHVLENTIKSVISQDCDNYEYIIIDGGSSDNSIDIIKEYDAHINYWVSERDKGIYHAMNKGISVAQGEYCFFLNAGDILYNEKTLSSIKDFAKSDFVCGNVYLCHGQAGVWESPKNINTLFWLQRCSLCHQATFIKTELLKKRPYDESLKIVGDWEQMFYELEINKRSYQKVNDIICYYSCDGVSSNHDRADTEKRLVIDKFRYLGYIAKDELAEKVSKLKPDTRRYKLVSLFIKFLEKL